MREHSLELTILLIAPSTFLPIEFDEEPSVTYHTSDLIGKLSILSHPIEFGQYHSVIINIIRSRQVDKYNASGKTLLVSILYILCQVQQLACDLI